VQPCQESYFWNFYGFFDAFRFLTFNNNSFSFFHEESFPPLPYDRSLPLSCRPPQLLFSPLLPDHLDTLFFLSAQHNIFAESGNNPCFSPFTPARNDTTRFFFLIPPPYLDTVDLLPSPGSRGFSSSHCFAMQSMAFFFLAGSPLLSPDFFAA